MRFIKHSKTGYSCPLCGVRMTKTYSQHRVVRVQCPACNRGFSLPRPIRARERKELFGLRKKGGKLGH